MEESGRLLDYQAPNGEREDVFALDDCGVETECEEGADGASATSPAHLARSPPKDIIAIVDDVDNSALEEDSVKTDEDKRIGFLS